MELNEKQLQEIKSCELSMLGKFKEICDKLNIKYYILGGTLLGAVRHKGFIPWDDDVDVFIMREDYEVFLQKAPSMLPEYYFLQTHLTDENYPNNFAKLRDCRTTFIEISSKNIKMNHGVYIDIFPLDFYPDNKASAFFFGLEKRLLTWRINTVFNFSNVSLKTKIATLFSVILYPSVKKAVLKREKLFKSVKKSSLVVNNSGAWLEKEIVPLDWCKSGVELQFENLTLRAPKDYDKWLSFVYGDYMQLPPESERKPHHFVEIFDIDKPYTEYLK